MRIFDPDGNQVTMRKPVYELEHLCSNWNRELALSVELLRMLTVRHLDLRVDVYFFGDDEEGTIKDIGSDRE